VSVFHSGASRYGILSSTMAVGTVIGALLAAGREKPRFTILVIGAMVFGIGLTAAAIAPTWWMFGAALVVVGVSALSITNTSNALMQLTTDPMMRGRVMALRLAVALGATPIGAPIVGWVSDHFGPRWALGVGAASGFAAAIVGLLYLSRSGQLKFEGGRISFRPLS
jgi:MFS family permease